MLRMTFSKESPLAAIVRPSSCILDRNISFSYSNILVRGGAYSVVFGTYLYVGAAASLREGSPLV